jgi:LmbE family N-acetylglucosaminyl deacetylase
MKKKWLFILFLYCGIQSNAQYKTLTSSEILHGLEKLNTLGNAMYVAAHPDDENTLLIAWLSKEKKVRTSYISMTRGDGGQNLIGSEQGEYVGLLRTHELLEARKIDGGEQLFTRAVDFGFTKKTEEAMLTWGKEKILEDLVFQIRKFKPDVIINRFPPDARAGHGHHSASAQLSIEAFDAAADAKRFPEQVKELGVWQAKRLVWNSFSRGFTNQTPEEGEYVKIALGDFNPLLGKSYTEIASEARSKHRSQGFGSAINRSERYDFAINIKGEAAKVDLFDGIDLTWNRIQGGKAIAEKLNNIVKNYSIQDPSKSVKQLLEVYQLIQKLPSSVYKEPKLKECLELIMACSGLYFEVNPSVNYISPGQKLKLFSFAINRSQLKVKLNKISIQGEAQKDTLFAQNLTYNKALESAFQIEIPVTASFSQPYWLNEKPEKGFYALKDESLRGLPMAPDPLQSIFDFEIEGVKLSYKRPVKYKYTEPSFGEIYKYLEIRPEVILNLEEKVYVFTDNQPKKVVVEVIGNSANLQTSVSLVTGKGWKIMPESINVLLEEKNKAKKVYFEVFPPDENSSFEIKAVAQIANKQYNQSLKSIKYEHIPELNVFPEAVAKFNKINLARKGQLIGYIAGAGDEVPNAIRQIGFDVENINETNVSKNLANYSAIIVGVRAYNTEDWLVNAQDVLLKYVENGGTLIVQYQTQAFYGTVKTKDLGPFPLNIGRGRVTDENADIKFMIPDHPLLNYPNKITSKDFEGWVQERGLYFADKWSEKYETILALKDPGEEDQEGSLLYAKFGKGHYIFTGLSFFRQLPAGIPGAYKFMSNLISVGK